MSSSSFVETPTRQFKAGAAIAKNLRVKLSSGKLAAAGVADPSIGTLEEASFADLDIRAVRLKTAVGTVLMVASGAISLGANVYGAASGKVSSTFGPQHEGIALQAATADGDIIEVLRLTGGTKVVYGQQTTVAASDTVVTGLNTVLSVVASMESDPGDDPFMCSAQIGDQAGSPAAGSILIKTWKNTSGTDPTPLAAGTFTKKINWIAVGT